MSMEYEFDSAFGPTFNTSFLAGDLGEDAIFRPNIPLPKSLVVFPLTLDLLVGFQNFLVLFFFSFALS